LKTHIFGASFFVFGEPGQPCADSFDHLVGECQQFGWN